VVLERKLTAILCADGRWGEQALANRFAQGGPEVIKKK
jgi:hypothetical protein